LQQYLFVFFFFQAEDGIRDFHVTGVQTCALPICLSVTAIAQVNAEADQALADYDAPTKAELDTAIGSLATSLAAINTKLGSPARSEERRVGKECRTRRATYQ